MKTFQLTAALAGGIILLIGGWLAVGGGAATAAAPYPPAPAATLTTTLTLAPSRDNTLYASELGTISNGAGDYLFAGKTQKGEARRALLAFDLSGIPPGATILTASLTLTMSKTIAGEVDVALHAAAANWGEGTSDAVGDEGAGALATTGDATWLHTFYNTTLWAQPGGDFDPAPSAVTPVGGPAVYTWTSPAVLADVAGWAADPSSNFGWVLIGDESADGTTKRFESRENEPAKRPRLAITYAAPVAQAFVPVVVR